MSAFRPCWHRTAAARYRKSHCSQRLRSSENSDVPPLPGYQCPALQSVGCAVTPGQGPIGCPAAAVGAFLRRHDDQAGMVGKTPPVAGVMPPDDFIALHDEREA